MILSKIQLMEISLVDIPNNPLTLTKSIKKWLESWKIFVKDWKTEEEEEIIDDEINEDDDIESFDNEEEIDDDELDIEKWKSIAEIDIKELNEEDAIWDMLLESLKSSLWVDENSNYGVYIIEIWETELVYNYYGNMEDKYYRISYKKEEWKYIFWYKVEVEPQQIRVDKMKSIKELYKKEVESKNNEIESEEDIETDEEVIEDIIKENESETEEEVKDEEILDEEDKTDEIEEKDIETKEEEEVKEDKKKDKQIYKCECIDCLYKLETEQHCKEISCPECGWEMRRSERPWVGKNEDEEIKTKSKEVESENDDTDEETEERQETEKQIEISVSKELEEAENIKSIQEKNIEYKEIINNMIEWTEKLIDENEKLIKLVERQSEIIEQAKNRIVNWWWEFVKQKTFEERNDSRLVDAVKIMRKWF